MIVVYYSTQPTKGRRNMPKNKEKKF